MRSSRGEIRQFQKRIVLWYRENKRDLPWRRTQDPYKILVSEVMLQQTQVARVIPKYEAWLKAFPKLEDLAIASMREVLTLWSGLGYNRRALYLQKTAQEVLEKHGENFPQDIRVLRTLPGVGEYTASAITCFAFDEQIAVVDTNVRKVIALEFFKGIPPDIKTVQFVATQILPKGRAKDWNQALMDYAASVLKKEKIPQVKQSRFLGSDRFYRGRIIKVLLQNESLSVMSLRKAVKDNFSSLDLARLERIVDKMIKEEILIYENGNISLKS